MNALYEIRYSNGNVKRGLETEADAIRAVLAEYPDAVCGHDGDLVDGGDRTLCWKSLADSVNDDARRAVCSIHKSSDRASATTNWDGSEQAAAGRWYEWTVKFRVCGTWVADGFDLTTERAKSMIAGELSHAHGHEIDAETIAAPDPELIALEQGYANAEDKKRKDGE